MAELDRLDVLLLNAAVATPNFSLTVDGYETTRVHSTTYRSVFKPTFSPRSLLSALLMPLLQKTARMGTPEEGSELKPRLVLISSDAHVSASFSQKNARSIYKALNKSLWFNGCERYRTTKLMALLLLRQFSYASGEKEKNDVVICAVNPGLSKLENMEKIVGWWRRLLYKRFATKTWQAAHDIEWACLENDIPSGSYVSHRIISDCASWIDTPQGQKVQFKLWKEMGDILSKVAPETENLWNIKGF
ncbi:hypothetical protein CPB86DRAFT_787412 [Serendipita vermifera]|nr:hypothetical protein CPB86DRAFT_787412 [Serendipita vermifera]